MAELQDPGSFILQVAPTYADSSAPSVAFLWEVPGGYEGRILTLIYQINYNAVRNIDKQSWVEVLAQNGDVLGRWKAPQMDWSASMLTFGSSGVSLAMEVGETIVDPATTVVFQAQQFGSLPTAWLPEHTVFNLVLDTDDNADFLSNVMTLVEGRLRSDALEADVVPPYTPESYLSQTEAAAA